MTIPRIASYPLPDPAHLPPSRAPWQPEPARAVLLLHDMQAYFADFFDPGEQPLAGALDNIRALRRACRGAGVPCVYTAQPEAIDPARRGLLNDMWGPGLTAKPERANILQALSPEPDDLVLHKLRYSAFLGTDLLTRMHAWGRDQLWICGVYAHIGCMVTAYEGFMRDIQPFLVADGIADFGADEHTRALQQVASTCGVVLPTERLLSALLATKPVPSPDQAPTLLQWELARLTDTRPEQLSPDDGLRELGMDSIRMMELVERLEDQGLFLDAMELMECETVADLAAIARGERQLRG